MVRVMAGDRGMLTLSSLREVLLDRPFRCRVQARGEVIREISPITSVVSWATRLQFAHRGEEVRELLHLQLDRRATVRAGASHCLVISEVSWGT